MGFVSVLSVSLLAPVALYRVLLKLNVLVPVLVLHGALPAGVVSSGNGADCADA